MSRKQSAFMAQMKELRIAAQDASRKTFSQYLTDTVIITLHRKGYGEKRIRQFLKEWGEVYDEFFDALRTEPGTDYYRAKMDEIIRPLCTEEPFIPFEVRYQFLPDIKY